MYCKNCGKQIDDNAKFCDGCGTPATESNGPVINIINSSPVTLAPGVSEKNKWIAFILCFFLGGFGIHRFYVGKTGTGILWLFTMGLCGIGSIIDLIVIVCGGFTDKFGNKLV